MADIDPLGLYIHIPFCETKCPYCDFNTYAGIDPLIPGYVAALRKEIIDWGDSLEHPTVNTVFFGGGTPSYLEASYTGSVLEAMRQAFDTAPGAEITLEANPGDLTAHKLDALLELGVNRLSIGVQSLDDRLLQLLGRRHSSSEAVEAFRIASLAGFGNVSIDLMYGLPHQSTDDWGQTLDGVADLDPPHVSLYCLTVEEGTPLEHQISSGLVPEPDPDLAADMYLLAREAMGRRGYRQYEISNWARTGFESRHNLTYWRNRPYLGVGPGSHSYLGKFRFSNIRSPKEYIRRLSGGAEMPRPMGELTPIVIERMPAVDTVETIDRSLEMAETLMMGLRLDSGIAHTDFASRFGATPIQEYGEVIDDLVSLGLLETEQDCLRLTDRGRIFGNEVFSRFFK